MFAVGAWNKEEKTIYLSRDRYGIKPLYYWFSGKTLVFASEVKAILAHPDFSLKLNFSALNEYFSFQNMFSYNTLFEGVIMLPPANTVKVSSTSTFVKHYSWWDYDYSNPDETMSFEEAKIETERLFKNAVAKQMISDVPVGSYLSGGMDSGSITALASRHVDRLSTFTCGFDMSEVTGVEANYDERRDAELMANYFKTEHYEQVLNAGDIKWSLPKLVYHLEDLRWACPIPIIIFLDLLPSLSKFVSKALEAMNCLVAILGDITGFLNPSAKENTLTYIINFGSDLSLIIKKKTYLTQMYIPKLTRKNPGKFLSEFLRLTKS